MALLEGGVAGLSDFVSVITEVTTIITGSTILSALFAGSLIGVAAMAFKKIKRAATGN